MAFFPFNLFDEEEKRRRMLTPGFNPNAPAPPDLPPARPTLAPPVGNPASMRAPSYTPEDASQPSYSQRYQAEKQGYLRQTPGRGRSALTGALQGFLGGGGLVGAAMGGLYGATNPQGLREREFNRTRSPQLLEQFGMEQADQAAQRQAEQDALNSQLKIAQIGNLNREHQPQPPRPQAQRPTFASSPLGIFNTQTGEVTAPAPAREQRPMASNDPRLTINPENNLSVEEEARASYEGRGGDKYVLSTLPDRTQRILRGEAITVGRSTRGPNREETKAAQSEFDRAKERQY